MAKGTRVKTVSTMEDFILFCKFHQIICLQVDTEKICFSDLNQSEIEKIFEWKKRNGNIGIIYHNKIVGLVYNFLVD